MTPCMDVYKSNIQSDGSLDKLKFIIVVRISMKNKLMIRDTWDPTASVNTLKHFLASATKHKARVHQFYLIVLFILAGVKHRAFVKLDSRYGE